MKNIIALSCLLAAVLMIPSAAWAADPVGTVVAIEGHATAKGDTGHDRKLDMSEPVFLNDNIKTGDKAKLQILFTDDTMFAMGENSEVTINEYLFNPGEKKKNGMGMKMGMGIFRVITGKITDLNPERFSLKSTRATIGIRGCELGFILTPKYDKIMMFFIPKGKEIHIDDIPDVASGRKGALFPPVSIFDQGTMLYLSDTDRPQKSKLSSEDIQDILNGTTPNRGKSHSGDAGSGGQFGKAAGAKGLQTPNGGELVNDVRGPLFEEEPEFIPPPTEDNPPDEGGRASRRSSGRDGPEPIDTAPWGDPYNNPKDSQTPYPIDTIIDPPYP